MKRDMQNDIKLVSAYVVQIKLFLTNKDGMKINVDVNAEN